MTDEQCTSGSTIPELPPLSADVQTRRQTFRDMIAKKSAEIKAENERLRKERNSRRWRAERTPAEYQAQKERQRKEYAAGVLAEEGREVRAYEKIGGRTKVEHRENARARHAEQEKQRYNGLSEEERQRINDVKADKQFVDRLRKKGMPEADIAERLAHRIAEREAKRFTGGNKPENWGRF